MPDYNYSVGDCTALALSTKPSIGFDTDQHWRPDLEDDLDSVLVYTSLQDLECSPDFDLAACYKGMRSVAENLSVEVEDTDAGCRLVEEDIEAAVAAAPNHCFASDSDSIHWQWVEDSRSFVAALVEVVAQR